MNLDRPLDALLLLSENLIIMMLDRSSSGYIWLLGDGIVGADEEAREVQLRKLGGLDRRQIRFCQRSGNT